MKAVPLPRPVPHHHTLHLCLVILSTFLLHTTDSRPRQVICPNGFLRFFRSCYKFSGMRASWLDAQGYCLAMGASLVTIEDRNEMKFLANFIRHHRELFSLSFWTGGNDIANEGEWRWTGSLAPYTYTHWYMYQPDNGRNNEHCMELEKSFHYQWNDQPCHLQNHYICEIYMY